jgi:alcohol dehydrogenase class IV
LNGEGCGDESKGDQIISARYTSPAFRIYSGLGSLEQLQPEMSRFGLGRAVIVCGRSIARDPAIDRVVSALGGTVVAIFDSVEAHTPVASVLALAEVLNKSDADCLVPVGGGSAMVTARAANILHCENSTIERVSTTIGADGRLISPRIAAKKLVHLVVPTTPTTAILKAGAAVTIPGQTARSAMYDPATRARAVFVDPDLCATAPADLVSSATANSLTMCVEGLVSERTNLFAQAALNGALRIIVDLSSGWRTSVIDPDRRVELVLASVLCGQGTDVTGGGITAALSHTIGHVSGISNGFLDGVLLPHVLEFERAASIPPLVESRAFGSDASGVLDALRIVMETLLPATRLRDFGLEEPMLEAVARDAVLDFAIQSRSTKPKPTDLLRILRAAW